MNVRTASCVSVVGVMLMAAGTGSGSSASDSAHRCSGDVSVATELPTSGTDAAEGFPAQNAAELAVTQADTNHLLGDCAIDLITKDDASPGAAGHDPSQGARNMTALAANQSVVGVVGAFDSAVCAAEMPIANNAGMAQISPACSDSALTQVTPGVSSQPQAGALQPTGTQTFFRVGGTDVLEASTIAQQARVRGATRAYVIDDGESRGLASVFAREFSGAGGAVAGDASVHGAAEVKAALADAAATGANLIAFCGTSSYDAAQVRSSMHAAGLDATLFVAADTVVDPEFVSAAGPASDGALAVTASPDPASIPSAEAFSQAYGSAYNSAPTAYSVNAYDAMNILLTAIKEAIEANGGTLPSNPQTFRAAVRGFVASISYGGATGTVAFSRSGDSTNPVATLWQVKNGAWAAVKTVRG
ncbi:MAG: branched-chain amino acid ABC transporter substrate-binding protein [Candidatus Dormibacteraeota bacterium]|nr:branched-chain amino acid ABC transporter substrate-binding protein [Candidatus Dormibacteraeota bacterium]